MTTAKLAHLVEELRRAGTDTLHVQAKRAARELPTRRWEARSA